MTPSDQVDISSVKGWSKAAHVDDIDALAAFADGRSVFDIRDPQKLEAFVKKHNLMCLRDQHAHLPFIRALPDHGQVFFVFPASTKSN